MFTLYTLTSDLHREAAAPADSESFIRDIEAALGEHFVFAGSDFSTYAETRDNVIYVRTGGVEGLFKEAFCRDGAVEIPGGGAVRLLTSGRSNSLAASMEILSFLDRAGLRGEILHGSAEHIAAALLRGVPAADRSRIRPYSFGKILEGKRAGVVGKPSDWLISSEVDYALAKERLGVEMVDIDIAELTSLVGKADRRLSEGLKLRPMNEPKFGRRISEEDFRRSLDIYCALKTLADRYSLDGVTLRCFDLLTALGGTGCMALAIMNSLGITAACEGDVPALLTMCAARELFGSPGFQANLSRIDGTRLLFAHCTVPLDLVEDYRYDTHFESGIGVAVHGVLPCRHAKIFKISPDFSEMFLEDVDIVENQYNDCLCRTQILIEAPGLSTYFLRSPIGNHHVII